MSNAAAAHKAVLDYWFGEFTPEQWFASDKATDAEIMHRFSGLHAELSRELKNAWRSAPAERRFLAEHPAGF